GAQRRHGARDPGQGTGRRAGGTGPGGHRVAGRWDRRRQPLGAGRSTPTAGDRDGRGAATAGAPAAAPAGRRGGGAVRRPLGRWLGAAGYVVLARTVAAQGRHSYTVLLVSRHERS